LVIVIPAQYTIHSISLRTMAAKQKLVGKFDSVSVATSAESATINGVVASVSPIHPGKRTKFFEAKLTDRRKVMRMVGF